jgi:tetratricopeptide (TPR) repeat protein
MPKSVPPNFLASSAQVIAPDAGFSLSEVMGGPASGRTLARLESAISDLRAIQIAPFLDRAVDAVRRDDAAACGEWALKALAKDEKSGLAWQLLGIAREKAGDFGSALRCYESALQLLPEGRELSNDIGRLAYRLGMHDVAIKLFQHFNELHPELPDGANNLAVVLRDQQRYGEAIDLLKDTLARFPEHAMMWNTLGSVVREQGDTQTSILFFEEAMRLNPHFAKARYNRGNARLVLGDPSRALDDIEAALAIASLPDERAMMGMARATTLLVNGRVDEGWDAYAARLDPAFSGVTHFACDKTRWTPDMDVTGKSMLVLMEQGLGDEILFANALPDLLAELGPEGHLHLAVEPRLVTLFQRSFPKASVTAHATYIIDGLSVRAAPTVDQSGIDAWAPIADLLRKYRRTVDAFPARAEGFLKADPERVAYWREVLKAAPAGRKVGLLWKSMKLDGTRWQSFSPFQQWAPVLKTPGVTFVNLQYGDCDAELALAKQELGVDIWTPPGIDLKQDLDDLAALSCALDLTLGSANATSNIAAACGANAWLLGIPGAWTMLGTGRYPWYPQMRVFNPERLGEWDEVMAEIAGALMA